MEKVPPRVYSAPDLILALLCFNNSEGIKASHYKLLQHIERRVLLQIPTMSAVTVLGVLHAYALAGRCFPEMLRQCDAKLNAMVDDLADKQIAIALWAYARLVHTNTEFTTRGTARFFASQSHVSMLSHKGSQMLTRVLWSLAVLERLEWCHMQHAETALTKFIAANYDWEPNYLLANQMMQVGCELRSMEGAAIAAGVTPEAVAATHLFLTRHFSRRPPNAREISELVGTSSWSHRSTSAMLTGLGVVHQNEVFIPGGYLVDILVPPRPGDQDLGAVIELDGPTHFESYLKVNAWFLLSRNNLIRISSATPGTHCDEGTSLAIDGIQSCQCAILGEPTKCGQ